MERTSMSREHCMRTAAAGFQLARFPDTGKLETCRHDENTLASEVDVMVHLFPDVIHG